MLVAHKIELRPTPEQEQHLLQSCGNVRHCYNQLLAWAKDHKWSKKAAYERYKTLKQEFEFYRLTSVQSTERALIDIDVAFKRFFSGKSRYPKFKKRGIRDSFSFRCPTRFKVSGRELRIEKLKTRIKMRQRIRFEEAPKHVTISRRAGKWFASFLVEVKAKLRQEGPRLSNVGVDLGVRKLATFSSGVVFEALKPLRNNLQKLRLRSRRLSRKTRGSRRYDKAKRSLGKLHLHVSNQRKAVLHNLSSYLTRNYDRIVIEDLNVSGMMKNRRQSRAIADCGFFELRRQLTYKSKWYDCELVIADRWFPSTKTCSRCGNKQNVKRNDQVYRCVSCGFEADRDMNAAINLARYA